MTNLIRAEVRKLTSLWSTYVLVAVTAAASGLLGLAVALAPRRRVEVAAVLPPRGTASWFNDVFSAMSLAQYLALVLGVLVVTGEYRHRTITSTYLAEPRRARVTAAKLVVSGAAGVVVSLAAGAAGLLLGWILVGSGDGSAGVMMGQFRHVAPGLLAIGLLFGVYGAGLGALLRSQVLALVVGLGVGFVVEPIIAGVWPWIGRWLPSQAARAVESLQSGGASNGLNSSRLHLLGSWEAAGVLLAYGVILAVAGSLTTLRSDVT